MQKRLNRKELLDDLSIPFDEIQLNMKELNFINSWLGGHAITVSGIRQLLATARTPVKLVVEMGSGGGDNLRALWNWSVVSAPGIRYIGIDINPSCTQYARQAFPEASYQTGDYRQLKTEQPPDILFSSLFCHHFTDDELVEQLKWMYSTCTTGFFINDLHRHSLAFYSIRLLTRWFSKSRLVQHDAPLSVQRGFVRSDWETLLQRACIKKAEIHWKWAFRWLILVKKKD